MAIVIPFRPSIGRYRFVTVIDTVQYIFKVRWNSRDEAWYFDVLEFDETPIVLGVKVTLGSYLGGRVNHPLFTQGAMVARPHAAKHENPAFNNLGVTIDILYFSRGDLVTEILGAVSEAT